MKVKNIEFNEKDVDFIDIDHVNGTIENANVTIVFKDGDRYECFIDNIQDFNEIEKHIPQKAICSII